MKRLLPPVLLIPLLLLPASASPEGETLLAPLRLDVLARRGAVTFRHSEAAEGSPADAFDGKPGTGLRTRGVNPAFMEATFSEAREIRSAQALFPGDAPHEWSLLAGEDADHMAVVFSRRRVDPGTWSRVVPFHPPLSAKVLRVVVMRLDGGADVEFGEIAFEARQSPERLEVVLPSPVVTAGGMLPARARIAWDGGAVTREAHGLRFETPREGDLRIDSASPRESGGVMLRCGKPGPQKVRAFLPGRGGDRLESEWREVLCEEKGSPDWCVGWIERTPRIDFDGPGGGWPAAGTDVLWKAHILNYGTADAPPATLRWEVDGKNAAVEEGGALRRFEEGTATLRLPWDGGRREIRCTVDPDGRFPETSEGNNARSVASDALLLGLWIEEPLHRLFHGTQAAFGDGANGFEDWAQRQVDRWNRRLAGAVFPLTPDGVPDRVALDRVVVVGEGELPLSGRRADRDPDAGDRTVDFMWGLPASLADGTFAPRGAARTPDNPHWIDEALLGTLERIRGLPDLRRLDVAADEVLLPGPAGLPLGGSAALPAVEGNRVHRSAAGDSYAALALLRLAGLRARAGNRFPVPDEGECLGDLPEECGLRAVDREGRGLGGVRVRAWRRAPGPEGREVFSGEPVRAGVTGEDGRLSLSDRGRDPFFEGERGGPLDAGRGVLLLELSRGGTSAWRFLEVVPFNVARRGSSPGVHHENIEVELP